MNPRPRRVAEIWLEEGHAWSWRLDAGPLALLAALTLIFFGSWIFGDRVPFGDDVSNLSIPLFHWLHVRLSQGLPTAWSQASLAGLPVFDHLITPDYYLPRRILLTLLDSRPAFVLEHAGHILWAAWGAYALCRQERRSPVGSLLAAMAFAFGGGMMFGLRWFTVLSTVAWAPWAWLGLRWIQEGSRARAGAGLLGLAMGACLTGGYPGMTLYLTVVLAILHAGWALRSPQAGRAAASAAPWILLAAVLAALQFAGIAHGIQRLAAQSARGAALGLAKASENSLSPFTLLQAFTPWLLGHVRDNSFIGQSWRFGTPIPQGVLVYIGIPGLLLAAGGMLKEPRRSLPALAALLALLVYALGGWTPAYAWIIRLPAFGQLRAPAKAMMLAGLLLAPSVARAWDGFGPRDWRRGAQAAAALGLALLLGGALLWGLDGTLRSLGRAYLDRRVVGDPLHLYPAAYYADKLDRLLAVARAHLAAQGSLALVAAALFWRLRRPGARAWTAAGLLLLAFAELSANGSHYLPEVRADYYARTPATVEAMRADAAGLREPWRALSFGWGEELRTVFPRGYAEGDLREHLRFRDFPQPNDGMLDGLQLFNGYSAAELKRYRPLHAWLQDSVPGVPMDGQVRELARRRAFWDLGAVRYVVSSRPLGLDGLERMGTGRPYLYRNLRAAPMAYLARRASGGWTQERAEAALLDPVRRRGLGERPALVEAEGPFGAAGGSLRWLEHEDHRWALDVENPAGPATLVLSRVHYRGLWSAHVDGVEQALLPCNAGFCALALPPGRHRVEIDEGAPAPRWTWAAWALSLAACLSLAGLPQRRTHA